MTAKQWLSRGRGIDRELDALIRVRQETYDRLTSITPGGGEGVSGTKDPHKFDRLAELDEMIQTRFEELLGVKSEILRAINTLQDSRQRQVMIGRYVELRTWEQIAVDMNYSYMQVTRLHGCALTALKDVIECYTRSVV